MGSSSKVGLIAVATGALLVAPLSAASATETTGGLDVGGPVDGATLVTFTADDTGGLDGVTDIALPLAQDRVRRSL